MYSVIFLLLFNGNTCANDAQLNIGKSYYEDLIKDPLDTHVDVASTTVRSDANSMLESEGDDGIELPRHLSPGRMYYNKLLNEGQERHWATRLTFHSSVAVKGFNEDSLRKPLSCAIFGGEVRLKDIHLLSRLSDDNKVRSDNRPARVPVRPPTAIVAFGGFQSDQYIALLANARLNPNAESREFGFDISTAYRFVLGAQERVTGIAGLIVPVKTRINILNLNIDEGSLFTQQFAAFGVVRATPLTQFSADFTGLFDFFERGVLAPKGIVFEGRQREMGFGDMTIFGLLDFADYFEKVSCLQGGLNIVLPTGRAGSQNKLFPVSLGNGSVQVELFTNLIFSTRARMFNPAFHLVGNFSPTHSTNQRVPQRIVFAGPRQRINLTNLLRHLFPPPTFAAYYVDPFDEFDTKVPAFANTAFPVKLNRANRILFGFGNYSYDIFSLGLQLALFYDIMHKDGDKFTLDKSACKKPGTEVNTNDLDFDSVTKLSSERSHSLSWTLSYQFKNLIELNIGSQHVIAGKNIPRTHEVYISFIAVF